MDNREKAGSLLIAQADHLSGEEIGWALEALSLPGVRNRNLIPTLTKKGRTGYMLMIDVEPQAEPEVARLLLENFGIYGYHRIETQHVHRKVVIHTLKITVNCDGKSIEDTVHVKMLAGNEEGPCFLESDDLFSLQQRIDKELGTRLLPKDLRRRIEALAESSKNEMIHLSLQ